jgi:DnaJ-class molecular chaperone
MPCRGSGHVISNLGGTPAQVTCPWCDGSGQRVAGTDAQATWLAERAQQESEQGSASDEAAEQETPAQGEPAPGTPEPAA